MKYLNSTFSVPGPERVMPGTCEACIYGRGEHAKGCAKISAIVESMIRDIGRMDPEVRQSAGGVALIRFAPLRRLS